MRAVSRRLSLAERLESRASTVARARHGVDQQMAKEVAGRGQRVMGEMGGAVAHAIHSIHEQ
ncbi:hypothetical protein ACWKT5_42115 [Streptomyces avermitilis]